MLSSDAATHAGHKLNEWLVYVFSQSLKHLCVMWVSALYANTDLYISVGHMPISMNFNKSFFCGG